MPVCGWKRGEATKAKPRKHFKRYGILWTEAHIELLELGYGEILTIYAYEQDGIEWECKVESLSCDMLVVPKGTPEWELSLYW